MKYQIAPVILLFFITSCTSKQDDALKLDVPANKVVDNQKGTIPASHAVFQIGMDESKTWVDMDQYYKNELPKEKAYSYYNNVKNAAFSMLVNNYQLTQNAPKEVIAFYIEEQANMPLTSFSKEFMLCLQQMKGIWPMEKIKQYAADRYEKNKQYYLNDQVLKDKWESVKSKHEPLLSME
jgi:hypothetical protein